MMSEGAKGFVIPAALVVLAFILRLYAALVPGIIVPDGVVYIDTARMIEAGQWQRVSQEGIYSLYPFMIIAVHKVFADWEMAGRIISVIFGSLAVLPLYLLFKRMFDIRIAGIVALFFVISPKLVEFSSNVIREPAFWFFSLSALWLVWEGMDRSRWYYMPIASLFIAMSVMTRMEGIALVPVALLWMGWHMVKVKEPGPKKVLVYLVIFLVSFPVIGITPLYFLKSRLGRWEIGHLGSKAPQFLSSGNKDAEQAFRQSLGDADTITRLVSGNKYVFCVWEAIYKFLRSYHVLLVFLFLIGIVRRKIVPRDMVKETPVIIWCGIFLMVSLLYVSKTFYLSTRHGMLMSIPALLWVSIGFFELSDIIGRFLLKNRPAGVNTHKLAVILLAIISFIILPSTLTWSGYEKVEMKKAGIYLKQKGYSKKKIAVESRLIRLGFYAEADYAVVPPHLTNAGLKSFLSDNSIDYLVVDERTIETTLKGYREGFKSFNLEKVDLPEFNTYKEYSFQVLKTK